MTPIEINDHVKILKEIANRIMTFSDESQKMDLILDICNEYKKKLLKLNKKESKVWSRAIYQVPAHDIRIEGKWAEYESKEKAKEFSINVLRRKDIDTITITKQDDSVVTIPGAFFDKMIIEVNFSDSDPTESLLDEFIKKMKAQSYCRIQMTTKDGKPCDNQCEECKKVQDDIERK